MGKPENRGKSLNVVNICVVIFIIFSFITSGGTSSTSATSATDLPFRVPDVKAPQFPNNTFYITSYGAVGDGQTKNTGAFAKAINACADAGGGRVVVPAGIWLTGPIQLKSNINLHLEEGTVVLFSPNIEDYPLLMRTWEGLPAVRYMPPLYGENLKNIAVTGSGIFDGSGQVWRPVKKFKMTDSQWKELLTSGGVLDKTKKVWWPSEGALNGKEIVAELDKRGNAKTEEYASAREYLRPVLVGLVQCKNVLLDGPTFQNSPAWNIHPLLCEDVIIRNINIRNPWWSQNGDGMDLESCRNVIVHNCRFDVGDDAICMKSGKNEYGRRRNKPTENVAIWDCTVYHGHGGFVVGSEMSGGVRNVYIRNCSFLGTDVGLRFKSTRGRGSVVENIYAQNIHMKDIVTDAVRFNMYYEGKAPIPEDGEESGAAKEIVPQVSEETPSFRNIYMKNIVCTGAERAIWMQGLPEMQIKNIYFDNIVISAKTGVVSVEADRIEMKNSRIIPKESPVFLLYNSQNFIMDDVRFPDSSEVFIRLEGNRTQAVHLKGLDIPADKIKLGKNVKGNAIITER